MGRDKGDRVSLVSGKTTKAQIPGKIRCSQALVRKWRKRWCQTRSLEEAARSGRPRMFEAIVRAKVTAFACSNPTDFDIPLARWSCSDIAAHLVTLGIVVSIATSTEGAMAKI